jgi:hypothetical protein
MFFTATSSHDLGHVLHMVLLLLLLLLRLLLLLLLLPLLLLLILLPPCWVRFWAPFLFTSPCTVHRTLSCALCGGFLERLGTQNRT